MALCPSKSLELVLADSKDWQLSETKATKHKNQMEAARAKFVRASDAAILALLEAHPQAAQDLDAQKRCSEALLACLLLSLSLAVLLLLLRRCVRFGTGHVAHKFLACVCSSVEVYAHGLSTFVNPFGSSRVATLLYVEGYIVCQHHAFF